VDERSLLILSALPLFGVWRGAGGENQSAIAGAPIGPPDRLKGEYLMNPRELKLFFAPKDRLRLTVDDDRSYPTVKPVWAAPLSLPNRYLTLLDGKGNEIVMLADPKELPKESWEAVQTELHRRYLTATVTKIANAKVEYGATYWYVETDRGPRECVTQNLQENAVWLSPTHLLLLDVDGNRFEIPDVDALDARSRHFIHAIL
jgi:hypothetical protein